MRRVLLFSLVALLASAGAGRSEQDPMAVEAVLVRSLLERAAFNACAALLPGDEATEHREMIATGWAGDLDETAKLLSEAGYPDDFIAALGARLDLEAATPQFSSQEQLRGYCAIMGDWRARFYVFQFSLPHLAIREIAGR